MNEYILGAVLQHVNGRMHGYNIKSIVRITRLLAQLVPSHEPAHLHVYLLPSDGSKQVPPFLHGAESQAVYPARR